MWLWPSKRFIWQANPFKERILEVFSENGDGHMNFEQFLDMMSQLSSKVVSASFLIIEFE